MNNPFSSISDISVDEQQRIASFSFADIKLQLHDNMIEVAETIFEMEKFTQAWHQLEGISASIEAMNGSVDESVLSMVNQDNKLGKLLGMYLPPSLRFEMAETPIGKATTPPITSNPASTASSEEKKEAGTTMMDRIKETGVKMWEVLKEFFAKIYNGLKSFWVWLRNGFKSNKQVNTKLSTDFDPLTDEQSVAVLSKAQGYLTPDDFAGSKILFDKLFNVPFLAKLKERNCASLVAALEKDGTFTADINTLLGMSAEELGKCFIKVIPASGNDKLPKLELDKEALKSRKASKASLHSLHWDKNFVKSVITAVDQYYDNVEKANVDVPEFIDSAKSFDWNNSELMKPGQDGKVPNLANVKAEVQSIMKFYTQVNKLFLVCCDPWQDHLDAIRKFMGAAATVQTAQPAPQTPPVAPTVNPAATATPTQPIPEAPGR